VYHIPSSPPANNSILCVSRSYGYIPFWPQNMSIEIPQTTSSEMHSKQPFHNLGKLRVNTTKYVHVHMCSIQYTHIPYKYISCRVYISYRISYTWKKNTCLHYINGCSNQQLFHTISYNQSEVVKYYNIVVFQFCIRLNSLSWAWPKTW